MAVIVSQDQALADDSVLQLNVFAEFKIGEAYVKFDQFTATLFRVTVPDTQALCNH